MTRRDDICAGMTATSSRRDATACARALAALVALLASPAVASPAPAPGDPPPGSKLVSQEPAPNEHFGMATVLSGDTVAVGAPFHDEVGPDDAMGAVYVYSHDGAGWQPQGQLLAPDAAAIDLFGTSVAIEGDTLVAGAPTDDTDDAGGNEGSVYVFVRDGGGWSFETKLEAPDAVELAGFGRSVSLSGDSLLVGADSDSAAGDFSGSAYVFVRSGGGWAFQAKLVPAEAGPNDKIGNQVALHGNTAVVSAPWYDSSSPFNDDGAVFVFVRSGTTWTQQALLMASDTEAGDRFGSAVSLGDGLLVVGSWLVDVGGITNTGAAYVFKRTAGTWLQQATLLPSDLAWQDHFGMSVAISSGGAIVVGSPGDDTIAGSDAGSAYVFTWDGGSWVQHSKLLATGARPADAFGSSVSIDRDLVLGSSTNADLPGLANAGTADVFDIDDLDPWTNLGSGLAGAAGVPAFVGTGALIAGLPVSLALSNAAPSALDFLFVSFASLPAPFKGGTLVPVPVAITQPLFIGPSGALTLSVPAWPAGVPSGASLYFQHAIQDAGAPWGVALSNALRGDVP